MCVCMYACMCVCKCVCVCMHVCVCVCVCSGLQTRTGTRALRTSIMSLPQHLREGSDFDQLPHNVPVSANIADIEENKGFIDYFVFVLEVKTKGGSKYFVYRRYREFFTQHQELEARYSRYSSSSPEDPDTCVLPPLPGKIFMGNKREIAESRVPELNTYMKRLLRLPTWLLLDEALRMFFYQTEQDSQHQPRALRRLRPPTRRVKTIKPKMDLFSSPRAEVTCCCCCCCCCNTQSNNVFSDQHAVLLSFRNVFQLDDVAVNYRDLEGDLIRVLDDEDVQLMIRESRGQRVKVTRPANQFPWELYVTLTSDLSVYNTEA
ncbi:neutrophil cytosol factor 4 [Pseudoliparis swirei]|uniref:neutrophil cytosol factor 4 n=1 Tax=Pseudoliparis swirei TaxID=2059687 RepID=UPI0024BD6F13|nr:neutrophil cytosol factor 4 [Pseudoliparis swirei]